MKILVCIKQVPYVEDSRFDLETRRLIREGAGIHTMINPYDSHAITEAVRLREALGGDVIAITMGPPIAKDALIEALAMGCDKAIHILGREFAGSDTLATARTLALACRRLGFDLIFCGKHSIDSDTAQVPAMLAELLDVPQITAVTKLEISPDHTCLAARRELDEGFETVECALPALLSVGERLNQDIWIEPEDRGPGLLKPCEVWDGARLGASPTQLGVAGSPTFVAEIRAVPSHRRRLVRVINGDVETVVEQTIQDLLDEGLFGVWKQSKACWPPIHPRQRSGTREGAIWVVAELSNGAFRPVTLEMLGCGAGLAEATGGELAAVLIGHNLMAHAQTLAAYGADRVYVADAPALSAYTTEQYAAVLADAIHRHDPFAVIMPSTSNGRDLAPRVAARLRAGLTGDCVGFEIDDQQHLVQLKPALGGQFVAPIYTRTRPAMATVRPGVLQRAQPDDSRLAVIEMLAIPQSVALRTHTLERVMEDNAPAGIGLDDAEIIVGVGIGIGGPHNLPKIQELAATLGAAIAATRQVVDSGWLPRQLQVGLTGRSVAPSLYVAVGISGSGLHRIGIRRSGVILAINSQRDAEIFEECDYGIVGDWTVVVPVLMKALEDAKHSTLSSTTSQAVS